MLSVKPTPEEIKKPLPGDDLVPEADIVLDKAMTLHGTPEDVWPWLQRLGRRDEDRGGWPLPASVERFIPEKGRAPRELDPSIRQLHKGDIIGDYAGFGKPVVAKVAVLDAPNTLVFSGNRDRTQGDGETNWSWALALGPTADGETRLQMRLRAGPMRHAKGWALAGGAIDNVFERGFAKGINERLAPERRDKVAKHPKAAYLLGGAVGLALTAGVAKKLNRRTSAKGPSRKN